MALNKAGENACRAIAKRYGIPEDLFCGIVETESAGKFFWTIGGKQMPAIRPETHYFYRALARDNKAMLATAVKAKLATKSQAFNVPGNFSKVYEMFNRMCEIDIEAACQSISMGCGQVMGANYKRLGFASAVAMWKTAQLGITGQTTLMAEFIKSDARLMAAFKAYDYKKIAMIYNGPAYSKNKYDTKLAKNTLGYAEVAAPKTKTMATLGAMGGGTVGIGGTILGSSQDAQDFVYGISPITDSIAMISEHAATIVGAATALVVLGFIGLALWKFMTKKETE